MNEDISFEGTREHELEDNFHGSDRRIRVVDVGFIDAYVQVLDYRDKPVHHTLGSAPIRIEH